MKLKKLRDIINYYKCFIKEKTGKSRFFKGSFAFLKSSLLLLIGKTIKVKQIAIDYDFASDTYYKWEKFMGKHVDSMIKSALSLSRTKNPVVLDLACGQGFVANKVLKKYKKNVKITCVDASEKMLLKCKQRIKDKNVDFIKDDAVRFLKKQKKNSYDYVFLSWALPYINHKKIIKLFKKVVKPDGIVGIISNSSGTLNFIDDIFVEVMVSKRKKIKRLNDLLFNLPDGENGLKEWFKEFNFKPIDLQSGEEIVRFKKSVELYNWLRQTGVLAGISEIFDNFKSIEKSIIKEIEKQNNGKKDFRSNHKFVSGVFVKKK